MHLEQLILKHDAHDKLLFLQQSPEGLDFHFLSESHALRFSDFIRQWAPAKHSTSKTLVSHDTKNNTYNYKYSLGGLFLTILLASWGFVFDSLVSGREGRKFEFLLMISITLSQVYRPC